jgi:hypothetical protein
MPSPGRPSSSPREPSSASSKPVRSTRPLTFPGPPYPPPRAPRHGLHPIHQIQRLLPNRCLRPICQTLRPFLPSRSAVPNAITDPVDVPSPASFADRARACHSALTRPHRTAHFPLRFPYLSVKVRLFPDIRVGASRLGVLRDLRRPFALRITLLARSGSRLPRPSVSTRLLRFRRHDSPYARPYLGPSTAPSRVSLPATLRVPFRKGTLLFRHSRRSLRLPSP